MSQRLVLALDVGGTKVAAGVVSIDDGDASIAARVTAPSRRDEGPDAMIDRLLEMGRAALAKAGVTSREIDATGVACGGPLDPSTGVIQQPPNLPGWHDVPLGARVGDAFGRPVAVENDATAATLAEHLFGAGRGVDDLVFFTISTGIGGGAISAGHLVRGATGNATELGHLLVDPGGRPCACGRRGCLEGFASGTNIAARAREAIAGGERSSLVDLAGGHADRITAELVVDALRQGDAVAKRVWDETTAAIAAGVTNAINAFDPDLVILGGGVTRAGDLLFEPVRRMAIADAMPPMRAHVRLVPAALGDDLGLFAAAAAAIDRFDLLRPAGSSAEALASHLAAAADLAPLLPAIDTTARLIRDALARGGRLVAFGNGGSAADAQHLVAELVGHFRRDRRSLPAVALTTDPSVVSAIANDYAWEDVFARQVEGAVRAEDVVIGISTSGNAENVIRGVRAAKGRGATTIALTGRTGGRLAGEADHVLHMPADATDRIQELHTFVVHALSEQIDAWAASTEKGDS